MTKHTVMDVKTVAISTSGLKYVKPPQLSFKIEIELDKKMDKATTKDPLLQQEFNAAAKEVYDFVVGEVEKKCQVFDKLFADMIAKGAPQADIQKQLAGLNNALKNDFKVGETAAKQAAEKAWTKLQSKKKEWKKFKIGIVCSIGGTVAGLAVSIAAMATSPFSGGASAVFGIMGLIKSAVTLAKEISKIAADLETTKKVVIKELAFVKKTAENQGLYAANEVSAAVLNQFLGLSQPSIKQLDEATGTMSAKFAQMVVKVHDAAEKLNKILNEQEKLKSDFLAEANKKVQKHPTPNKAKEVKSIEAQLDKALKPNYDAVTKQLEKVGALNANIKKQEPKVEELKAQVEALKIKDPTALKVFREALKLAALATAPLDGNGIATEAKDLAMGVGEAAGGYVYDKIVSAALDGTVFDAA